jgi:hypothetical protein
VAEDEGLTILWNVLETFIAAIVGPNGLGIFYDQVIVGVFDAFVSYLFDVDNLELIFSLFMALILFGLFYRYIFSVLVNT